MPSPDRETDVRDLDPSPDTPDPGFNYGGLAPMEPGGDQAPIHRMPPPDGPTDVRDLDPAPGTPDPGFNHGGLAPMAPGEGAPPVHQMPPPDRTTDVRDLNPAPGTNPDPGFNGIQAMSAPANGGPLVDGSGGSQEHRLAPPDSPTDVRDLNPAPGTNPDPAFNGIQNMPAPATGPLADDAEGGQGHRLAPPDSRTDVRDLDPAPGTNPDPGFNGIQAMSAGGGGGGVQSNFGSSGVEDPAALNRAGENSNQFASLVQSKGRVGDKSEILNGVRPLAGDNWGGDLGLALFNIMETWDKQAKRLTNICAAIGEKCVTTANNQTRTESANEAEMNAVRSSLSDFE